MQLKRKMMEEEALSSGGVLSPDMDVMKQRAANISAKSHKRQMTANTLYSMLRTCGDGSSTANSNQADRLVLADIENIQTPK